MTSHCEVTSKQQQHQRDEPLDEEIKLWFHRISKFEFILKMLSSKFLKNEEIIENTTIECVVLNSTRCGILKNTRIFVPYHFDLQHKYICLFTVCLYNCSQLVVSSYSHKLYLHTRYSEYKIMKFQLAYFVVIW